MKDPAYQESPTGLCWSIVRGERQMRSIFRMPFSDLPPRQSRGGATLLEAERKCEAFLEDKE